MFSKLPKDFNPERYRAAYPDVALSGLSPQQHYRLFGRALRRSPSGNAEQSSPKSADAPVEATPPSEPAAAPSPEPQPQRAPIIDRPKGFDAAQAVSSPAAPRLGGDDAGVFRIEELKSGPFAPALSEPAAAAIDAYAALFKLNEPTTGAVEAIYDQSNPFREGFARIENAWFSEPLKLRMMLAGRTGSEPAGAGWGLRAYQATSGDPSALRQAGPGVTLSAAGPCFMDVELADPLMPVLIELIDDETSTRAWALWAFPSLLPGGVHAAELRAVQDASNPMDGFWHLSDELLSHALKRGTGTTSVGAIHWVEGHGENSALKEWMASVFGIGDRTVGEAASSTLRLVLPDRAIPTVAALATPHSLEPGAVASGAFIVTIKGRARPQWSVAIPRHDPECPVTLIVEDAACERNGDEVRLPLHLAIVERDKEQFLEEESGSGRGEKPLDISAVISATDTARCTETIERLLSISGDKLDLWLWFPEGPSALRDEVEQVCRERDWPFVPAPGTLLELAQEARHETLLTVSDTVTFDDNVPDFLASLLRYEDVASASCALVGPPSLKPNDVNQPSYGGLFPTAVSFRTTPQLAFGEPDVLQVLGRCTYSVVANTFSLTAWSRRALLSLPATNRREAPEIADIRLGLDFIHLGYRNLSTTEVIAKVDSSYRRRDFIDPVGSAYLQPQRWESIFERTTVLRELF